jgi:hypothetical protein
VQSFSARRHKVRITKVDIMTIHIPIASGKRIYSRWQYAPYFENNSLQVIQPDIGNCGNEWSEYALTKCGKATVT